MPRTTPEAVAGIIEHDEFYPLGPFIETANALVEEYCAPAKDADGNLLMDDVRLELIERWLSAHFYAIEDARVAREAIGGSVMTQFEGRTAMGLDHTRYGQQAKLLDSSGALAALDARSKLGLMKRIPRIKWLGSVRSRPRW
jgi:hypothetical protein